MNKKASNLIDIHVGNRVRMARLISKMSQERLGEILGLTFQQVQKYEKGANRIGSSRLWQISKALRVDIAYFFKGLDDPAQGDARTMKAMDDAIAFVSTQEGQKLVTRFMAIEDKSVRDAILDLLGTPGVIGKG